VGKQPHILQTYLTATVNLSVIYDRPLVMVGPGKGYLGKDSIVEPVSIL